MTDTHCHLYTAEFDSDISIVMERAFNEGINKFYLPAIDMACTGRMDILEERYPNFLELRCLRRRWACRGHPR